MVSLAVVLGGAPTITQAFVSASAAAEESPAASQGVARLLIAIPRPLARDEVERLIARLGLSEADGQAVDRRWATYLDGWSALRGSSLDALDALAVRVPQVDIRDPEFVPVFEQMQRARRTICDEIARLDAGFFEGVREALHSEDQLAQLMLFERRRRLVRLFASETPPLTRDAGPDLVTIVEHFAAGADEALPSQRFTAELVELLESPLETRIEASWKASVKDRELLAEAASGALDVETFNRRRSAIWAPVFLAERRIAAVNRQALDRAVEALDRSVAERVKAAFLESAYPELYPDPNSTTRYFKCALTLTTLSDQQRIDVAALGARLADSLLPLAHRLERLIGERNLATMGDYSQDDEREHQRRLTELLGARSAVNSSAASDLVAVLTEEQVAELTSIAAGTAAVCEAAPSGPPPAP